MVRANIRTRCLLQPPPTPAILPCLILPDLPCLPPYERVTSYNPALGLRGLSVSPSARQAGTRCDIRVDEAVGAPARYRYMYTPLEERAASLEKGLLSLQV